MTHTKGPWKVNKFSGRGSLDDEYAVTYTHPNGYVQTIARVVLDHPESMDGVAANAHLIAAAPEMLGALEGAKWLIDSFVFNPAYYEEYQDVVNAIKKARGEE